MMMENEKAAQLVFSGDPKGMNWFREDYPYAQVQCPGEFSWEAEHSR